MLPNDWDCQVFPTATNCTRTDSFTVIISTTRPRSSRYATFSNSYRKFTCYPYEVTAGIVQSVQCLKLGDGQQRNRGSIPGKGNVIIPPKVPARSGCLYSLVRNGHRGLCNQRYSGHPQLVSRVGMSGATPPAPYSFMTRTGITLLHLAYGGKE
jgi:hypothetical protein